MIRITIGFMAILACAALHAQTSMDSLIFNYQASNIPLEKVFLDLEVEYGIQFSYATTSFQDKRISAKIDNENIEGLLDEILAGQDMEYKIVSKNILIRKSSTFIQPNDESYKKSLHLKGLVVQSDQSSNGLDLAVVAISNSPIGTYTDEEGRFDIEIPEKYFRENLIVHSMGFEDQVYRIEELSEEFMLVPLKSGFVEIDEIIIVNRRKTISVAQSNGSLSLSEAQRSGVNSSLAGSDISRQIQLLPGVSAHDDSSTDIKIRGSNSDETMVVLDGMPLYHTSHYYNIFSSINANFVDSFNLYRNNYPLNYDGKTGGMVEMQSLRSQPENTNLSLEVNLMTASGHLILPITKKSMLSVALRSSLRNISNTQFNTFATKSDTTSEIASFENRISNRETNPEFSFCDLNTRFQTQIFENGCLGVNFYQSHDDLENDYTRFFIDQDRDRLRFIADETVKWKNLASSIDFEALISENIGFKSKLLFSQFENFNSNTYQLEGRKRGVPIGAEPSNSKEFTSFQENLIRSYGAEASIMRSLNKQKFEFGLSTLAHKVDYLIQENRQRKLESKSNFLEFGSFGEYKIQAFQDLKIDIGLRASYFDQISKWYFSPRFRLAYNLSEIVLLKSSFGNYQQVIRQLNYEYRGQPMQLWIDSGSDRFPILKSRNTMLGTSVILDYISIDIEAYYKNMDGMLEYAVLRPGDGSSNPNNLRQNKLFIGDGRAYGIDVLLSTAYRSYDSYFAYTLSKTEQRFKEIAANQYYPTEDDRLHQFKWINTLTTGSIIWGANLIYVSGRRYTDLTNLGSNGDITEVRPQDRFSILPDYKRLDLSVSYDFNLFGQSSQIAMSVINVLNSQNVKYIQSVSTLVDKDDRNVNTVVGADSELLDRTFNISLRVNIGAQQ